MFPAEEAVAFLRSFADALAEFTGGLEQYTATADLGTRYARLALGHGLAVHRASLQWAEHTIRELSAAADGGAQMTMED